MDRTPGYFEAKDWIERYPIGHPLHRRGQEVLNGILTYMAHVNPMRRN